MQVCCFMLQFQFFTTFNFLLYLKGTHALIKIPVNLEYFYQDACAGLLFFYNK